MRRGIFAAAALVALFPLDAIASHEVTAGFYAAVAPDDDNSVTAVSVCEARAARVTTATAVLCTIDDAAPGPGISSYCSSPGPVAVCQVSLVDGTLPVRLCATAYATLADLTTDTHSVCRTYTPPTR